jgi:bla regulator protein blaR1
MIAWALETMLAVNLLILLVLIARRPVASLCGAGWAYALWLLPLLRLVLPPLPIWDVPALSSAMLIPAAGEAAAPLPSSDGPGQWVPLMLALWAGGAAAFILWQIARYRGFLKSLSASLRSSYPPIFEDVPVLESRAIEGPIAIGFLDPRIVVPFDFLSRYSPAEQRLALAHERIHHRRGDLWWNGLALLVLALNWFNPLAWLAFRAFRADQELACDAAVARAAAPAERHDYARALVKAASRPGLIAACPLHSADQLKRRLKMMKNHRVSRLRSLGGSAAIATLFAAGLGLSAPLAAQDQAKERVTERKIIVREVGKDGGIQIGDREFTERLSRCPEAQRLMSDVTSGEGKEKQHTRVVICSKDGTAPTPAMRERLLAALERARSDIGSSEGLSPEGRTKALEALRREIEKVRSQGE